MRTIQLNISILLYGIVPSVEDAQHNTHMQYETKVSTPLLNCQNTYVSTLLTANNTLVYTVTHPIFLNSYVIIGAFRVRERMSGNGLMIIHKTDVFAV